MFIQLAFASLVFSSSQTKETYEKPSINPDFIYELTPPRRFAIGFRNTFLRDSACLRKIFLERKKSTGRSCEMRDYILGGSGSLISRTIKPDDSLENTLKLITDVPKVMTLPYSKTLRLGQDAFKVDAVVAFTRDPNQEFAKNIAISTYETTKNFFLYKQKLFALSEKSDGTEYLNVAVYISDHLQQFQFGKIVLVAASAVTLLLFIMMLALLVRKHKRQREESFRVNEIFNS